MADPASAGHHPDSVVLTDDQRSSRNCAFVLQQPFLQSIKQSHYEQVVQSEKAKMALPLQFESVEHKWNFYSLLHMLNFGSGWRTELKAANGMGAFDNIIRLLISSHISSDALDVKWMESITVDEVAAMMQLDVHVEVPVANHPQIKQMKPTPLLPLLETIVRALHETASFLKQETRDNLIEFIQQSIADSRDLDKLMLTLARLPVLNDASGLESGETIYIFKKMQVMLSELMRNGLQIPYVTQDDLSVFADNVIPTMLQHYDLISCPSADQSLRSGINLSKEETLGLRAASVVICQEIVEIAAEMGLTWIGNEVELDNYLWKVAKEGNLRLLPRYVDKDTYFF